MINPNTNALPTAITSGTLNNVPAHIEEVKDAINGGSLLRRLSQAQIDALSGATRPTGLIVQNLTTAATQKWTGAEWVTLLDVRNVQRGTVAAGAAGYADVTFPFAFGSPPVVTVTPVTTGVIDEGLRAMPYVVNSELTGSGMRIRGLSLLVGCHWVAIGY